MDSLKVLVKPEKDANQREVEAYGGADCCGGVQQFSFYWDCSGSGFWNFSAAPDAEEDILF